MCGRDVRLSRSRTTKGKTSLNLLATTLETLLKVLSFLLEACPSASFTSRRSMLLQVVARINADLIGATVLTQNKRLICEKGTLSLLCLESIHLVAKLLPHLRKQTTITKNGLSIGAMFHARQHHPTSPTARQKRGNVVRERRLVHEGGCMTLKKKAPSPPLALRHVNRSRLSAGCPAGIRQVCMGAPRDDNGDVLICERRPLRDEDRRS